MYDPLRDQYVLILQKDLGEVVVSDITWTDDPKYYETEVLYNGLVNLNKGQRKALDGVKVVWHTDFRDVEDIEDWYNRRVQHLNKGGSVYDG